MEIWLGVENTAEVTYVIVRSIGSRHRKGIGDRQRRKKGQSETDDDSMKRHFYWDKGLAGVFAWLSLSFSTFSRNEEGEGTGGAGVKTYYQRHQRPRSCPGCA